MVVGFQSDNHRWYRPDTAEKLRCPLVGIEFLSRCLMHLDNTELDQHRMLYIHVLWQRFQHGGSASQ